VRVLVTGSDGYLGCLIAPALARLGHDVVGLDAGFYRQGWLFHSDAPRPPTRTADVRDLTARDLAGFEAVVHTAELSNDPLGALLPAVTEMVNRGGSRSLAVAAREAGVRRFVYMSSCSVYGDAATEWVDESAPLAPQTEYARCKALVEQDLVALADDRFCPVSLRNATAYGASPRMRFDIVLNNLAGVAHTAGVIAMTSDGTPWRPLVHASDIAHAVACALEAPDEAVRGEVFNIGNDEGNHQVREIAEVVGAVYPQCEVTFGEQGADRRSYRVRFEKSAQRLPGFRCRWDVERGARQLREVFDRVGLDVAAFTARPHTRLTQLQHLLATDQLDAELRWTYAGTGEE
jgi:nucleoside-diphosphate-sugar epimerase